MSVKRLREFLKEEELDPDNTDWREQTSSSQGEWEQLLWETVRSDGGRDRVEEEGNGTGRE